MCGINVVLDIYSLAGKGDRAAKRLLETRTRYIEGTLKLKVNQEKSRAVSVFATRNFKYLGFTLGKNGKGIYIRVHAKPWKRNLMKLGIPQYFEYSGLDVHAVRCLGNRLAIIQNTGNLTKVKPTNTPQSGSRLDIASISCE